MDHETFIIQLNKSPLLADYSGAVSWFIPLLELFITVLLLFRITRLPGLLASFSLMILFTFYIIAILGFSEYIPCSCGGILSKMTWGQHLVFNAAFCVLAVIGIRLSEYVFPLRKQYLLFAIILTCSTTIFTLYQLTYHEKDKYSSFDIRTGPSTVYPADTLDLKFNSYYFAGADSGYLYLGNGTSYQHIVKAQLSDLDSQHLKIKKDTAYHPIQIRVKTHSNRFFMFDGINPKIFTGSLDELIPEEVIFQYGFFNEAVPMNDHSISFRVVDTLGNYSLARTSALTNFYIPPNLLIRQMDGRFSVDGMLHYNASRHALIYVYYYRNQFIVMDTLLKADYYGKTLDSVNIAKIKVSTTGVGLSQTSVVIPEVIVNNLSHSSENYLYINSAIRAKNESKNDFNRNMRFDVFNLVDGRYIKSFYIPKPGGTALREFRVVNRSLYALQEQYLFRYDISHLLSKDNHQTNFTGQ